MFDKLVESNTAEAEFKPRRKFFMVSTVIVGILFLTAVVASLYAANIDLGNDNFDLAELLAPIAQTEPIREEEPPRQQQNQQNSSDRIIRQVLMASTEDYLRIPDKPSTERNPYRSISPDKYNRVEIGSADVDLLSENGRSKEPGTSASSNTADSDSESDDRINRTPPPPPTKVDKKPVIKSLGVINGEASYLPKPPYPAPAKAVGASGAVNVQVTIDESGNVISAKAAGGHPLLRKAAEDAARRARFSPTTLSKVPVKVTGIIVYNFTR